MAVAPKMMPHSLEAEEALLGCLLIDNDIAYQIMDKIISADFYLDAHKHIFECMQNIHLSSRPIDFITLVDELEGAGILESVGGINYVTTLTNIIPSASNWKEYLDIVARDGIRRRLIHSAQDIINKAYTDTDKSATLAFAEKAVYDISQAQDTSSLQHISSSLTSAIDNFNAIAQNGGVVRGVPTGIKALDDITSGLQPSDLILLAARPSVGKSALAMQIANHAAVFHKKKVALFSLEMPAVQLAQRSLCSLSAVSLSKALKGQLSVEDWQALWAGNKKLSEASIFIDDSSLNTPVDVLSKCRRIKHEHGLDLIVIDYLQLMLLDNKDKDSNRTQEVGEATRLLKIAAKELNVPIILLSQLSRAPDQRKDHRPILSDLRESGSIEQDADIVMFIYKADMYNDVVNEDGPGVCELIIAKHRNGTTGTVKLRWIGELVTFIDKDAPIPKIRPASATSDKEGKAEIDEPEFDADELAKTYGIPEEE